MHSPDLHAWQRDTWQSRAACNRLPLVCEQRPVFLEIIPTQTGFRQRQKKVKQQEHHVSHF